MVAFQIRKIQSIIIFIIVLVAILWLFQDNIMEISLFQKNSQQSDNIKEEINEAAYLEKIDNFLIKEYSKEQLLLHIIEAETYSRKKNKPVELLNVKVTTYDEFGQQGVVLTSNRAEILKSGEIFFNGKVNIQSKNGVSHDINTESLIVFSNMGQIKSNRKVNYLGKSAKIDAQGMEMNFEDDTMSLVGKTIINQDSGSVIETTNLFIVHADGEKLYKSIEKTFYSSNDNKVSADKGMDLDMNENLMTLLGKVEILNSSGSTMNSYNLIIDQSNGGEVYKTSDSTHYQTQGSDIRAKRMHYDAKTKKVELMGGVLGVYE
jgi:LPS export ABC transporter protein LptC